MLAEADFHELWLPLKPQATSNFEEDGLVTMPRVDALKHRWFNTNTKQLKNLIMLDIDLDQSEWHIKSLVEEEGKIPEPSFVTINPASEHAQVGYFIDGFVTSEKAVDFFKHINKGLSILAGGDAAYGAHTMRNPLHEYQRTVWGTDHLYTLNELNAFASKVNKSEYKISEETEMGQGRNVALFEALRKWGYRARLQYNDYGSWVIAATERANELNFSFSQPLRHSEVRAIVASTTKWVWRKFDKETFIKIQKARSAKRAVVQNAHQRATDIMVMVEAGFSISEVAENLGISYGAAKISIRRSKERLEK